MVVQTAELLLNDTPSRYNKDLTDFLERNIQTIITKGQIKFRFRIIKPSEISSLRAKGVKRLPAMMLQNRPYIGVPVIVEELRKRVKRSKSTAAPKSEEEVLNDYFNETLGNIKYDDEGKHILPQDDGDDDDRANLGNLYQQEMKRREGGDDDGGNRGGRGANRRGPPKPDRYAQQDNDYEEDTGGYGDTMRPGRAPAPAPRLDNIEHAEAGDPMATLNAMKPKNGRQSQDDDMMRTLLERMGGDGGFDI